MLQRGKIREVCDVGQADHRDIQRPPRPGVREPRGEGVLIVDLDTEIRHNAEYRQPGERFDLPQAGAQDLDIAPEFVHDQTPHPRALRGGEEHHRPVELGKHPAPVNVAREQHRRVHKLRKAHVHNVVFPEVDLRRAARALDHDHVVLRRETFIGRQDLGDELLFVREIFRRRHLPAHPAVYDDLASRVARGLEQDGVHARVRLQPRALRLHGLRPPDLKPLRCHRAVERHVLALERRCAQPVLPEDAAEGGAQKALARAGHGALDHDALCSAHAKISLSASIRRSLSSGVRIAVRYQLSSSPVKLPQFRIRMPRFRRAASRGTAL